MTLRTWTLRSCLTATLLALLGCSAPRLPDLGGLYAEAARRSDTMRNPVIVIPGILGSRLEAPDGTVVWGAFTRESADPASDRGARLVALPMRAGAPLAELRDEVAPAGALESIEVELFGLPIVSRAYAHVLSALGVGGYRDESLGLSGSIDYGDEHFTCFQFDYDWRRDLPENAARFARFVEEKRAYVERELGVRFGAADGPLRFDVVAHSMGGLLVRYYLRYGGAELADALSAERVPWTGAADFERVILVGTPNAGSAHALIQLVEGIEFSALLPSYPAAVLGTMPAVYQLLPRERHRPLVSASDPDEPRTGLFDPATWERYGWGLLDPDQGDELARLLPAVDDPDARRAIARDHVAKCLRRATAFQRALDRPAAPPDGLDLVLFSGDAEPTAAVLTVDDRGRLGVHAERPGDGTVTRASALGDERSGRAYEPGLRSPIGWRQVTFLFTDHLGLTRDPAFTDNVLWLLLEAPR